MAHPTELPRPPNGNSSEASWFMKLLRCVRERSFIAGSGIRLEHKTNGTVISATAQPVTGAAATPSEVGLFRIVGVYDDVLKCYRQTETDSGPGVITSGFVWVLKPFDLRRSPFHNKTWGPPASAIRYTYEAAANQRRQAKLSVNGVLQSGTEYQIIVPHYQTLSQTAADTPSLGSQIFAIKCADNNSAYRKSLFSDVSFSEPIEWIDITPGRLWAEDVYTP
jgi:hypothetical protein